MGTILLAYEREPDLDRLEEVLAARGHVVVRASNGIDALDAARREPPALVISDILLPKMDGFALCRKWKQDDRLQDIPFVFFTTRHDDPKYERFAEELAADRFIAKSSEPDALVKAVDELVARGTSPGTGTARLPAMNEATLNLSAQVTELMARNRRLTDAEATFRALFERNPAPIWVADAVSGRHAFVNDAALALFGYSRQEFLALAPPALRAADEPALPAPTAWYRRKNGETVALHADSARLDVGGHAVDVMTACDVTGHLVTERAAEAEAARQRSMLATLPDAYRAVDPEGRVMDANAAYCELTGYSRDELVRLAVTDLEQQAAAGDTLALTPLNGRGATRYTARHRCRDGRFIDVDVTVSPGPDAQGWRAMFIRDRSAAADEHRMRTAAERRRAFVLDLQQAAELADNTELQRRVLLEVATRTASPWAAALEVSGDGKTLRLLSRIDAQSGQPDDSGAEPGTTSSSLPRSGPWVDAVRVRQPVIANTVRAAARLSVLPPVERCLIVPVPDEDDGLTLIVAANRASDYEAEDRDEAVFAGDAVRRTSRTRSAYERTLRSLQRVDVANEALVDALRQLIELHDPHAAGSASRVALLAVALGRELGLDGRKQHALRLAGLLRDIGKTTVPAALLAKPTRLTEPEQALLQTTPEAGRALLANIDFDAPVAEIVHQHRERMDGSGYPRRLSGKDILLEARILAVADAVELHLAGRPSRPAVGLDSALDEIAREAGKGLDDQVVAACTRLFRDRGFTMPA